MTLYSVKITHHYRTDTDFERHTVVADTFQEAMTKVLEEDVLDVDNHANGFVISLRKTNVIK